MTILGIDPGLAACGWAVLDLGAGGIPRGVVACGVVRTPARMSEAHRVAVVERGIADLLAAHRPAAVAIEAYVDQGARSRAAGVRAHIEVARAIGALQSRVCAAGIEWYEYSASRWMPAICGAGKRRVAVGEAVRLRLGLDAVPIEHAADAIGVALYHAGEIALWARAAHGPR